MDSFEDFIQAAAAWTRADPAVRRAILDLHEGRDAKLRSWSLIDQMNKLVTTLKSFDVLPADFETEVKA